MRAVVIRTPGGPDVLELRVLPDPPVPFGHVRVRVRYAGVNRADLLQRLGSYPPPPGAPADIPGLEYSGVIDAVGEGVRQLQVGARVYGVTSGGAYADRLVVHENEVASLPEPLPEREMAGAPEGFLTAYDALFEQGNLRPGERVLIHAVGSGVGTAALQLAVQAGAQVIGTSRTATKLDQCRALGLAAGIVVQDDASFSKPVRDATAGEGVDVVLDLVGGGYLPETLRACATGARVIVVGLTGGRRTELDLSLLLRQRIRLQGTVLRWRSLAEKMHLASRLRHNLTPMFLSGRIRPVIDRVFPLSDASTAHAYLETNSSFGKVLLAMEELILVLWYEGAYEF